MAEERTTPIVRAGCASSKPKAVANSDVLKIRSFRLVPASQIVNVQNHVTRSQKSPLHLRPVSTAGEYTHVTPEKADWQHLSFAARLMSKGEEWNGHTGESEYGFVVLGGVCAIDSSRGNWECP